MAQRIEALSLTHYRIENNTFIDADLHSSDIVELGSEAQYAWLRMLTGPEYGPEGFPAERLRDAFEDPRAEFDYQAAVQSLIEARMIHLDGDFYVFPNVVWGPPPEETEGGS